MNADRIRWRALWRRARKAAFVLALAATVFFGLFAPPPLPTLPLNRPDLLLHFLAFAACAMAAPRSSPRPFPWPVLLLVLAGSIELIQLALEGRSGSLADFFAGAAGIGLGSAGAHASGLRSWR